MAKKLLLIFLLLILIGLPVRFFILGKQSASMSPQLGLNDGWFVPCPDKPNCVSTQAPTSNESHYIKPNFHETNPLPKIKKVVLEMGMEVEKELPIYLKLIAKSSIFGFVDDVEFYYDEHSQLLHFRSSSRVGYSDMDANRKRILEVLGKLKN